MTAKRTIPALALCIVGLAVVPAAWAAPPPYAGGFHRGYEINPYFTWTHFQNTVDIDDDGGFGFRFGYLANPNQEVEFTLFDSVYTHDTNIPDDSVDMTHFQMAWVYNFTSHAVVPYFTIGVGGVHWRDSFRGTETDPVFGAGFGLRFFLGRTFYTRFEARYNTFAGDGIVFADNTWFNYSQLAIGLGWRFPSP